MQDTVTEQGNTPAEPKAPWDGAEFDEERARTLVANLRGEVKQLKADLAEAKSQASRVSTLEAEVADLTKSLADKDADLARAAAESTKKALLAERGLDPAFMSALSGDDEESWTQMADLIASVRGEGKSDANSVVTPDPVQAAMDAQPSGDAARMALAEKFFG